MGVSGWVWVWVGVGGGFPEKNGVAYIYPEESESV